MTSQTFPEIFAISRGCKCIVFFLRMLYTVYGEISCTRSSAVQAQNATGEIALSTTVSRWLPLQLFVGPAIVENLVKTTHAVFERH